LKLDFESDDVVVEDEGFDDDEDDEEDEEDEDLVEDLVWGSEAVFKFSIT